MGRISSSREGLTSVCYPVAMRTLIGKYCRRFHGFAFREDISRRLIIWFHLMSLWRIIVIIHNCYERLWKTLKDICTRQKLEDSGLIEEKYNHRLTRIKGKEKILDA
jgi:hypothetical protein